MRRKINLLLSLIALIAVVATAAGMTLVYYSLFQKQVRTDLRQNAGLLVETDVFQKSCMAGKNSVEKLRHFRPGNLRLTWIDKDGTVLFDNDADIAGLSNHMDRPEIRLAFAEGEGESTRRSDTMGMDTFYYALLLKDGTVLRVSMQARTIFSVLLAALPVIAGIAAVILMACILIGHFLARQILKPLEIMAEDLDDVRTPVYKELEPFADKIRTQHENILAAAKSRQDFTANVSHELKTPITAISGYAELIENRFVEAENAPRIARQIRHNADRLMSLITDIIQLSELDHTELPRKFEPIDLLAAARECVEDLTTMADRKAVTLSCRGIPAGINADRALIREMIENLVQNGILYNKENGRVDVFVTISNSHPVISVRDTGIGIPADQLDRVFERFYRVDKSRSRETGGTGLGLAIVKHIAELHSAEISIDSTAGKGTEVQVRF